MFSKRFYCIGILRHIAAIVVMIGITVSMPAKSQTVGYDAKIGGAIGSVRSERLYELISELSGEVPVTIGGEEHLITSRYTENIDQIKLVTQFIYEYWELMDVSVSYHQWTKCYPARNVVAEKRGVTRPEDIVLVTAHVDSMPASGPAPGADDNATGTAVVMLAAEMLSQFAFDKTIRFVVFTGEEQFRLGSIAYAETARERGDNIVAVFNVDMVGWDSDENPILRIHTRLPGDAGYADDMAIANTFVDVVSVYGLSEVLLPVIDSDGETRSDHASFWDSGFPAVLALEDDVDDLNPNYHKATDRVDSLNMGYVAGVAKSSLGTVGHLALRYNSPFYLTLDTDEATACAGNDVVFPVEALQAGDSASSVDLSASGAPYGSLITFADETLPTGTGTNMTVALSTNAEAGDYAITVSGTAASFQYDTTASLKVVNQLSNAPLPIAPVDGTRVTSGNPTFSWAGHTSGAENEYEVVVATDPVFSNVVFTKTVKTTTTTPNIVMGPAQGDDQRLAPETTYYWHVREINACGPSVYSETSAFETGPAPTILLVDDDNFCPDVRGYYVDALDALGLSYDVWDTYYSDNEPDAGVLMQYAVVIWATGNEYGWPGGPGQAGEAALATYLENGGRLFVVGPQYLYRQQTNFLLDYLGIANIVDYVEHYSVSETAPLGAQSFPLDYPNDDDPWLSMALSPAEDAVTVAESMAIRLTSSATEPTPEIAGVAHDGGIYRTVFFAFPLEAIASVDDRKAMLDDVLQWLNPPKLLGDVNGDGVVTIVDALLIAQYYVDLDPKPFDKTVADVNCDGLITIVDALLVAQYYVDLIDQFSCDLG